ncbi:MAG: type VI secretion system protein ImpL [Phenylobacterium sp.]|jgi:type VI secretion system protein ImpL
MILRKAGQKIAASKSYWLNKAIIVEKIKTVLRNKWFIQGVGLLALFLLIWFVGPMIAVGESQILESVASRLLLILVITMLWLGNIFRVKYLIKNKNDEMMEELGQNDSRDIDDETNEISRHFDDALKTLNATAKNSKGNTHLYELPWYIIIGPPGSGKTTALVNSGLHFPLESEFGKESLRGVGGTRHCDWWFTSEAVMIDTAGRFTTQDSHESVDKAAWQKFMDLLKQYRKQRPINGAIVAVSITDIMALSDHERANYAHTIRSRIDELTKQLGIRFPVYFMFTKCDLVAGFSEFFAHLNSDERAQVWGETFALDGTDNGAASIEHYPQHFDQLITRLKSQVLTRVNAELDIKLRPAVLGFPSQMASLRDPVSLFLRDVFSANRFQDSGLLRGVYYTSGTQEGTPLDRLLGSMASNWGVKAATDTGYQRKGKSYFLRRLLQEVIFPEAELAGVDQKVVKRRRLWQRLGFATATVSLLAAVGFWVVSYQQNIDHITNTGDFVAASTDVSYKDDMVGADFIQVLDELNEMRSASQVFDDSTMLAHAGLYQGDGLGKRTVDAYLLLLEKKLLPVIVASLQEMIIEVSNQKDTALTYELLKGYLMYAGINDKSGASFDAELLLAISRADWQQRFATEPAVAKQLIAHHEYLLEHSKAKVALDSNGGKIVSMARNLLSRSPLSQQVYQSVKQALLQDHSKDLTFNDIAGNQGLDVFMTSRSEPLAEQYIPGMFTKAGFYQNFILEYGDHASDYLDNNWVLGQHHANKIPIAPEQLKQQVYRHYYADYSNRWGDFLTGLKVRESNELNQGLAIINSATTINGPFETLLTTVAAQTDLSQPIPTGKAAQGVSNALGVVSSSAQRAVSKVNRLVRETGKVGLTNNLGKPVTANFKAYHRLLQTKRGEPQLTRMMEEVGRFSQYLEDELIHGGSEKAALEAVKARVGSIGSDRFKSLRSQSKNVPLKVKEWLNTMSQSGWSMMLTKARKELNRLWNAQVVGYYNDAIKGRYPLDPNSKVELELRDFSEFFRPKGIIEQFVQQHMTAFIDIDSKLWQQKMVFKQSLQLPGRTIRQLQDADRVTRLFFPRNAVEPKMSFVMKPIALDAAAKQFRFKLGDQQITYAHGPLRAVNMSWPLIPGQEEANIQFTSLKGRKVASSTKGPWSLFKMLDLAQLESTGQQSVYRVTFSEKKFDAKFELRADSEFNPLGARLLQNFTLPMEL